MTEPMRVRGNAFASYFSGFQRRVGAAGAAEVLAQLGDRPFAAAVEKGVFRTSWYPYSGVCELLERMETAGGPETVRAVARAASQEDLNGFLKLFLATFGTPAMFASKASLLWRHYYDSGEFVVADSQPGSLKVELRHFPLPHRLQCAATAGWLDGAMDVLRVRQPQVLHSRCRTTGDAVCEYHCTWR